MNSDIKTVKVIKILGIKIVDGVNQKPENYWFNPSTRVVYDFELDFPIGRVKLDDEGLPKKEMINDELYYMIDEVINIPKTRIV